MSYRDLPGTLARIDAALAEPAAANLPGLLAEVRQARDDDQSTLQVGDRVEITGGVWQGDHVTVIEPPRRMYDDDPGPRVRVERAHDGRNITPLVTDVRQADGLVPASLDQQDRDTLSAYVDEVEPAFGATT